MKDTKDIFKIDRFTTIDKYMEMNNLQYKYKSALKGTVQNFFLGGGNFREKCL